MRAPTLAHPSFGAAPLRLHNVLRLCLVAGLVGLWVLHRRAGGLQHEAAAPGWSGSFLHALSDPALNARISNASAAHRYSRCRGDLTRVLPGLHTGNLTAVTGEGEGEWLTPEQLAALVDVNGTLAPGNVGGINGAAPAVMEVVVKGVPCASSVDGCCERTLTMRPGTTDYKVFRQVFQWHYMRSMYAVFQNQPPRHVLDAGANAGYSTLLFSLLWPNATVVALEPDPDNFEALQRQVQGQPGVHAVNAGLWGREARISQVAEYEGAWGKVFQEIAPGSNPISSPSPAAMAAQGVSELLRQHRLPSFDLVKIDIEGAEGAVFDRGTADLSWIRLTKVICLEVHDYFGSHFGLGPQDISKRIHAVMRRRPFKVASDNEHVLYLSRDAVENLPRR